MLYFPIRVTFKYPRVRRLPVSFFLGHVPQSYSERTVIGIVFFLNAGCLSVNHCMKGPHTYCLKSIHPRLENETGRSNIHVKNYESVPLEVLAHDTRLPSLVSSATCVDDGNEFRDTVILTLSLFRCFVTTLIISTATICFNSCLCRSGNAFAKIGRSNVLLWILFKVKRW